MKRSLLGAVLMLAMRAETSVAQPVDRAGPSEEPAIRQVMADLAAAWNKHDIGAYSELFTEDVDFTNWRGTLRVHGRAELRNSHAPLFAGMFRRSRIEVADVRVRFFSPTTVAVHCVWEVEGIIDYDGKGTIPRRTYLPLFILTKDHGTWLIAIMHNVLVQPLPPGAEDKIKGSVNQ